MKKIEELFLELGYSNEELIKMGESFPNLYGLSIENIKQKIEDLIELGYTKEEVIKMTKQLPALYGYSIENIKQKIEDLIELGYTKEEVIKMTKQLPQIYNLSIENIKQKIEDLIELGYTKEEVIKITKQLPALYGYSIENIKQKIEFYDSIGLYDFIIIDTKMLMQSVSLSYARYQFYEDIGINVDISNYKCLFIYQEHFKKRYGLSNNELIEKYNYNKYLEEKSNERTI